MRIVFTFCAGLVGACSGGEDTCSLPIDAGPGPDARPPDPLCEGLACGGDPTGNWRMTASCASGSGDARFFNCLEGRLEYGDDFAVRGDWQVAADGAVTLMGSEHASAKADLPLSCFGLVNCASLEAVGEASLEGLSATCRDVGPFDESCNIIPERCDCDLVLDDDTVTLNGTMTWDSNARSFTFILGAETVTGEYCATASELWLRFTRFGGVDYRYRMERLP